MFGLGLLSGIWSCGRQVVFSYSVIGSWWWWGCVLVRGVIVWAWMWFGIVFWFLSGELGVG